MSTMNKVFWALLLTAAAMWAQGTAQINGTVKDAAGLGVPGAEIKATQTATGAVRTVTSSSDGAYVLQNLPIGPYMLEVTRAGFSKYVQTGIVLQVDGNPTVDAALKVGAVTEQVTVQADAALVETHSTGVGTVVDNQRVLEMPLNGRNVTELIYLAGLSTIGGANGGFLNSNRNYPTVMISVTGGVANWIQFNWDGAGHNDAYNSLNLPLAFPDALQEFKVESSALPAQYGQHASANVNVVTKSGGNEFHGDGFEFLRNNDFNARDSFALSRDPIKRNQWGGTVGGRIIRNKLFFFAGYQNTILHTTPSSIFTYIPTTAMLAGDFTTFASPACNNGKQLNASAASGFVGNKISPSRFDPAAVKIASILPTGSTDPCGKVAYSLPFGQNEKMVVGRVDWQQSDKHSLYFRPFATNLALPATYDGKNAITANSYKKNYRVFAVALGDTYLFGSNIVNAFHLGANRSEATTTPDNFYSWLQLGVNAPYQGTINPRFTVTGGNGYSFNTGAAVVNDNGGPSFNINDDVSWVRGTHQFGFGGAYNHTLLNYASATNSGGTFAFNGTATGGLGWADFMLGQAATWKQGNFQTYLYNRQNYVSLYAQDSWKVTSRLTVNYGVRWEPFFAFSNKNGYFDHFDPALFAANVHSTLYPNAPAGIIFPGDPQWAPGGNKIANNRYGTLLPRLGVVWDPRGNGKTSVRASIGMFTDRGALYSMSAMAQDSPYGTAIQLTNAQLSNPWANYPGGNPLPYVLSKTSTFAPFGSFITDNFNWKPTWVNQFNLSIQHQFGDNWLVTANYVGNTTSHLITEGQINASQFLGLSACTINGVNYAVCSTTANTSQRRLLNLQNPAQGQYYGIISTTDDGGTASYNALFFQAQKRLGHGVTILSNYTWSHCISDLWNGNPGNNGASAVTPLNRRNDRGNCNLSDQRQLLNLSIVATTPKFTNRALRILASDWQVAPIVKIKSAQFYTVGIGTVDQALNGEGGQRATIVPGVSPYVTNRNACTNTPCIAWGNPAAFALPALGTLGNVSNFAEKGPGVFQFDLSLSRTFPVWGEHRTLQIRAEAFNLPNHLNPAAPGGTVGTPTSFNITSDISGTSGLQGATGLQDGDYRVIQLAAKFVF